MEKKSLYIETERLIVRSVRESDAEVLYRIKTDPRVMEYCPDLFDVDAGREDMPKYIRGFLRLEEEGDPDPWRVYPIENRETGEVMGCLTASLQNMLREYELGWMMLGQFTKQGYASEAAAAYAEYFSKTRGSRSWTSTIPRRAARRKKPASGCLKSGRSTTTHTAGTATIICTSEDIFPSAH